MKNIKQIGYAIKIAVILCLFTAIWYKVSNNKNWEEININLTLLLANANFKKGLFLAMLLMPVNWLLESIKWKILITKIENISLFTSFKAVLAGVTISVFTPNRIGEYAGRVLFLKHSNRIQAALSTLISSSGQLVVTAIAGAISFYFYFINYLQSNSNQWVNSYLLILLLILIGTLLILFVSTPSLILLLRKFKALKQFKKYVRFFNRYTTSELLEVLGLSALRFATYCFQFYILLIATDVEISVNHALIFIPVVFFSMTIIPSIALAELGVREGVALFFIGLISDNSIGILLATFILWFVNLVIPAIVGSLLIFTSKIFNNRWSTF